MTKTIKKEIVARLHKSFEEYAHRDGDAEFWYARELQQLLDMLIGKTSRMR